MARLAVIGDIFLDIVATGVNELPSKWSTDSLASSISLLPGGSALNLTVQAANYNIINDYKALVSIYSGVGSDQSGLQCKQKLKEAGVQDKVLMNEHFRTGTCIVISGEADRSFITDRGCVDDINVDWFDYEDITDSDHLHIAGFFNCSSIRNGLDLFLSRAIAKGLSTSLNPQYDAKCLWDGIQELCPYLDFIICNQDELLNMSHLDPQSTSSEHTNASAAQILFAWGCRSAVIVTMGSVGATVFYRDVTSADGKVQELFQAAPFVQVVDTTGMQLLLTLTSIAFKSALFSFVRP